VYPLENSKNQMRNIEGLCSVELLYTRYSDMMGGPYIPVYKILNSDMADYCLDRQPTVVTFSKSTACSDLMRSSWSVGHWGAFVPRTFVVSLQPLAK
jgi:hypothetical protein